MVFGCRMTDDPAMISSANPTHIYETCRNQETQQTKTMRLRWTAMTLIGAVAMFVTSAYAGTTKKGYVFSNNALYVHDCMNRIKAHDMEGAMRMINQKKVFPLKEGLDVVIIEVIQGGLVRFRLRSTPVGFLTTKGTYYTLQEAIQ
jgi:hypothetical protein